MPQTSAHRKRIMYFIGNPHTFTGSHRSLRQLLLDLPDTIEPLVAAPMPGLAVDRYERDGIPTLVIPAPDPLNLYDKGLLETSAARRAWLFLRHLLPYSLQLARVFKQQEIELIHCNDTRAVLLVGFGARLARRPVVCHIRGEFAFGGLLKYLAQLLPHRLILVAEALRSSILPKFRSKAMTIHNTVDERSFRSGTPESTSRDGEPPLPGDPEKPAIAVLATVVPAKGIHHLLEALRLVREDPGIDDPLVLIAGDAPDAAYLNYLKDRIERWDLGNVRFLGYRSDPETIYRRADLVVVSSVPRERLEIGGRTREVRSNEGLPRAAIEAMFFGKPVITTDVAGASEAVLDGETGVVVPSADPDSLARAIVALLRDSQKRTTFGYASAAHCRDLFAPELAVARTLLTYQNLGVDIAPSAHDSVIDR